MKSAIAITTIVIAFIIKHFGGWGLAKLLRHMSNGADNALADLDGNTEAETLAGDGNTWLESLFRFF